MKKIMFNDKYGLTQAVLAERKTQTRRIIPSADHENRRYEGVLTISSKDGCKSILTQFSDKRVLSAYAIGEEVAIAQAYRDIAEFPLISENIKGFSQSPGWKNKMFVSPVLMPHHIRITNIRVERLQDISDKDCLAEGIKVSPRGNIFSFIFTRGKKSVDGVFVDSPRKAYAALIDKVSGKGTWDADPYVFVYEFELIG